jgi:predicted RNA-binding Zn-ribbon protein involved in translation (DUF1610 family)
VMGSMPGAGCTDPRSTHPHWCGFCGAYLLFSAAQCRQLVTTPECPRCREVAWRNEVDELAAPDYREPR